MCVRDGMMNEHIKMEEKYSGIHRFNNKHNYNPRARRKYAEPIFEFDISHLISSFFYSFRFFDTIS